MTGYQILWENHSSVTVHLLYFLSAAVTAVSPSNSTVHQSNHFTRVLQTQVHTSVTFLQILVCRDEKPLLMVFFLKVWKLLLFTGDGLADVQSVDTDMLTLSFDTLLQWHPGSEALFGLQLHGWDVLFEKPLRNFSFMSFVHTCAKHF